VPRESPGADDVAATKRSYAFVMWVSVLVWVALVAAVVVATHRVSGHRTAIVVAAVSGLALLGWLAFLRGLRRRELSRSDPTDGVGRYDPRSR
jgi:hypothetical protein